MEKESKLMTRLKHQPGLSQQQMVSGKMEQNIFLEPSYLRHKKELKLVRLIIRQWKKVGKKMEAYLHSNHLLLFLK